MSTGYIRVPDPDTYAALPFTERVRLLRKMRQLINAWEIATVAAYQVEGDAS